MKKRQASNSQAKRAQIAAAKKAKRERVTAEFCNGDWQRTKRAEEAKRKRRLVGKRLAGRRACACLALSPCPIRTDASIA